LFTFWNEVAWTEAYEIWSLHLFWWFSTWGSKWYVDRMPDWDVFELGGNGSGYRELRHFERIMQRFSINEETMPSVHPLFWSDWPQGYPPPYLDTDEFELGFTEVEEVFQRWLEFLRKHLDGPGGDSAADLQCLQDLSQRPARAKRDFLLWCKRYPTRVRKIKYLKDLAMSLKEDPSPLVDWAMNDMEHRL